MNELHALQAWGPYAFGVAVVIVVWRVIVLPMLASLNSANESNLAACHAAREAANAAREAAMTCQAAAVSVQAAAKTCEHLLSSIIHKEPNP